MWALDPANSGDLIDRLRPHGRNRSFEVAWAGEGWRPLVEECHERLQAAFPDYELLAIKQKYGGLEYQAFPADGLRAKGSGRRSTLTWKRSPARSGTALSASVSGAEQPGSSVRYKSSN